VYFSYVSCTDIFQDSSGTKALIDFSFSTISFTATDCTLPAERPFLIFFQRIGDTLYHTSLSSTLLACCASTRSILICFGFLTASVIAFFVISWNAILFTVVGSSLSILHICHPIASHSRSSSVAIHTSSWDFASFLRLSAVFFSLLAKFLKSKKN